MDNPQHLDNNKTVAKTAPRPAPSSTATGKQAEQLAEQYLQRQGLYPLARNFRCKSGELDLIMRHDSIVVFVEVKYRKNNVYGGALLSLSVAQQRRILRAAAYYLMRYAPHAQARFDVIAIEGDNDIQWIPNAFDAS